jgi:hypothetical protein
VAVPESLAQAAAGRADGQASGTVHELSNRVLRTMLISKLNLTPVAVVCAALAGALFVTSLEPRLRADTSRPAVAVPRRVVAQAPAAVTPTEWKVSLNLELEYRATAVAACADLIAVAGGAGFDTPEPFRVRLWTAKDGKVWDDNAGGAYPSSPPNVLRFTAADTFLVVAAPSGLATRYHRRAIGGMAGRALDPFYPLAWSADLNTVIMRRFGSFKDKPNQLLLYVNPWEQQGNITPLAVIEEECETLTHAAVSADDRRFAVAGDDAVVRVYNRANLRVLHKITLPKKTRITAIQLSDDGGRLAVVGEAGFAKLFDDAGTEVCDLKGHEGTVSAVAFAPDGKRVATARGKVARVFDTAKGKLLSELVGHKDTVAAVAFSTDGKRIVTGSADKTAKVWVPKD